MRLLFDQNLVSKGLVENFGHGLYRLSEVEPTEVEPTEVETIAMVAAAVPNAIMCLLTALSFHEIGTQLPQTRPSSIPVCTGGMIAEVQS